MCRKAHIIAEGNIIGRSPHHLPERANIILMVYLLRKNDVIRYAHNEVARELQSNSLLAMKRCLSYNVAKPHFISASDFIGRSPLHLPKANIILMMYLLRKNDVIRYAHNEVAHELQSNSLLAMKRCLPNVPQGTHHCRRQHHWAKPTSLARKGKHHFKKALANGKCLFDQPHL